MPPGTCYRDILERKETKTKAYEIVIFNIDQKSLKQANMNETFHNISQHSLGGTLNKSKQTF